MSEEDQSQDNQACAFHGWHYCAKFDEPLYYSEDKEDGQHPRRIGVFSSRDRALAAIKYCQGQPGFRDWQGSFKILPWVFGDTTPLGRRDL